CCHLRLCVVFLRQQLLHQWCHVFEEVTGKSLIIRPFHLLFKFTYATIEKQVTTCTDVSPILKTRYVFFSLVYYNPCHLENAYRLNLLFHPTLHTKLRQAKVAKITSLQLLHSA